MNYTIIFLKRQFNKEKEKNIIKTSYASFNMFSLMENNTLDSFEKNLFLQVLNKIETDKKKKVSQKNNLKRKELPAFFRIQDKCRIYTVCVVFSLQHQV